MQQSTVWSMKTVKLTNLKILCFGGKPSRHQCRKGAVETIWCVFEAEWIYSVCPEEETPLLIFLSFGRSNPFYFCPAVSVAATFHLQLTFCCMATFLKYLCSAGQNASIWLQKSIDSTSTVVAFTQHRWLLRPQRLALTVKPNKLTENVRERATEVQCYTFE